MSLPDGIQGFEPYEASAIIKDFVCAVCWSSLITIQIPGDRIMIIACPEHGNIELCGRITKNTVSIELERGAKNYDKVIRNLHDLWGHLINLHVFKCLHCGNHQVEVEEDDSFPNTFRVICPRHPHIIQSVTLRKEKADAYRRSN